MSDLKLFLKENQKKRENVFYPATKALCDENGEPLLWEIKHLTTTEMDDIRESCTIDVPVTGQPNLYRPKLKTALFQQKLICAAIVSPNLMSAELQDSYGVKTPEALIREMIINPGEYNDLMVFINKMNNFVKGINDSVDEAKN